MNACGLRQNPELGEGEEEKTKREPGKSKVQHPDEWLTACVDPLPASQADEQEDAGQ